MKSTLLSENTPNTIQKMHLANIPQESIKYDSQSPMILNSEHNHSDCEKNHP